MGRRREGKDRGILYELHEGEQGRVRVREFHSNRDLPLIS